MQILFSGRDGRNKLRGNLDFKSFFAHNKTFWFGFVELNYGIVTLKI